MLQLLSACIHRTLIVIGAAILPALASAAAAPPLLDEVIEAHGGRDALNAIRQIEFDSAGYFIGRYQSRTTHEPYDRLPVRTFVALDYDAEAGVWDGISTWPGELNMGSRDVVGAGVSRNLNTITRVYSDSAHRSFASMRSDAAIWLPPLLVRRMMLNPERVVAGEPRTFRNIAYDTLRYADRYVVYIHPETRLIHAVETEEGAMWDHTLDEDETVTALRFYDGYITHEGVAFPTRYNQFANGVAMQDRAIYDLKINRPIDRYLETPAGFERADSSGYGGEGYDVAVRKAGDGLYVTGNGDTHILYAEVDDYFIALEAGGFPSFAEESHEAMRPYMNGKPLRYIVPLHHHDDHAWAVHYYARIGAGILTTQDKEGFLRKLLARTWGEHGPVEDATFEFIDGDHLRLGAGDNAFDIFVWPEAPHAENMIVGYHPQSKSLFTGDLYIAWAVPEGGAVRQGASYSTRALDRWVRARQRAGDLGEIENYIAVHGRPYTRADMQKMLATERTITVLPGNDAWPTASWPARYGLADDTVENPRREKFFRGE